MGMNIIAIVVVLGVTYLWLIRGFFSAFIHLLCVIVAGAIAFAAWEPLAYWILGSVDPHGLFAGSAWGIALAVPFAITLIVLRIAVDLAIPANAVIASAPNYIGGGVCGLVAGVIASGFVVISTGFMRVGSDVFGYQPITYSANGSLQRDSKLWFPTDVITSKLYGNMSKSVFGVNTPLAVYYHDLADAPHVLRMSFGEGANRITAKPGDFAVEARYAIGDAQTKLDDLLVDGPLRKLPSVPAQRVTDLEGNPFPQGSRLEGFVVRFNAGAREKTEGKISVGASQVKLLVGRRDPLNANNWLDLKTVYPIAAISQAEASTPTIARFRYDARDVYLASVGGASEAIFAFEFLVPPSLEPIALTVKGIRQQIVDDPKLGKPAITLKTALERDAQLSGAAFSQIFGAGGAGGGGGGTSGASDTLDTAGAIKVENRVNQNTGQADIGIRISDRLPYNFTLQKSATGNGNLEIDDKNFIIDGKTVLEPSMAKRQGIERPIRIEAFATTPDTAIVQLEVSGRRASSLLGQSARTAELIVPPLLRDTNGQIYEPIGYVYEDTTKVEVRFTPGTPIRAQSELPSLTTSRSDQNLILIFRVSRGVNVRQFTLGNKVITEYDPPVAVK
jgi:uncharacterized membrane protein required for colicin V production